MRLFGIQFGGEKVSKTIFDQQAYGVLIDEVLALLDSGKITRESALFRLQRLRDMETDGIDPLPYIVGLKHLDSNDNDGHRILEEMEEDDEFDHDPEDDIQEDTYE